MAEFMFHHNVERPSNWSSLSDASQDELLKLDGGDDEPSESCQTTTRIVVVAISASQFQPPQKQVIHCKRETPTPKILSCFSYKCDAQVEKVMSGCKAPH
ncbi:hypothetical protein HAX54_031571 [Datura stramonium]|uniref:Uncharacterized protein n=1 Tax=Datura stramonium TaxID=4076 RepID=A0ABS8RL55_DATST|nr:hypothetical protein [Datura stramonium]